MENRGFVGHGRRPRRGGGVGWLLADLGARLAWEGPPGQGLGVRGGVVAMVCRPAARV
jgi:hypothetical protein